MTQKLFYFAETAATVIQAFIIGKFLVDFNEFSLKSRKNKVCFLLISFVIAVTTMLFNSIAGNFEGALGFLYPVSYLVLSIIFFKDVFLKKIFGALAAVSCILIANIIIMYLFGAFLNDQNLVMLPGSLFRVAALVTNQIILLLIYRIVLRITHKERIKLSPYEWFFISAILFFSLYTYVLMFILKTNEELSPFGNVIVLSVIFGLILIICIAFYFVFKLNRINAIDGENKRLKEFYNAEQKYAEAVKTQYEELRRIRHDMKQLIETVSVIAATEKSENILKILNSAKINLEKNDIINATDNIYVNAVLTAKISEARAKSIKVNFQITKEILAFDSLDLCYLLGNLLDNAIEACDKSVNPFILIELLTKDNTFEVTIKNSIPRGYTAENLQTSKSDIKNHGFGIKSIRHIADKYNGLCDFYTEDDVFISFVLLKTE